MKRNHLKKLAIVLYIVIAIIPLIGILKNQTLEGSENLYDFDTANSWDGNLPTPPLNEIAYESKYRPFSEIVDDLTPDNTKTYVIESATDLYYFSFKCNENPIFLELDYVLGKDIDYYEAVIANPDHLFIPVGFREDKPFKGSFNGQGFEITNLYYKPISTLEDYDNNYPGLVYYSMFSVVGETGVIRNLGIINPIMIQPINWSSTVHGYSMMYASALVGLNEGLIEHVYLHDNRQNSSGLIAEGGFHIAGLVSYNNGTIRESYVATEEVKSQSVKYYASSTIITSYNRGVMENVYYDSTLHNAAFDSQPEGENQNGIGLATTAFQGVDVFEDDCWYFNDHYSSKITDENDKKLTKLDNIYPSLRGISFDGIKFEINNALDFVYMMQLLEVSSYFRNADYIITSDIDMNMVSSSGFLASKAGFSGTLKGAENITNFLIDRNEIDLGGNPNYPIIINLSITAATEVGNFASYGLFSVLFGTISNLNFINMRLETTDINNQNVKEKILVGLLAAQINGGNIKNVNIHGNINIKAATKEVGLMHIGGLFGEGKGKIEDSTLIGNMSVIEDGAVNSFSYNESRNNYSAMGGFIGYAEGITVSKSLNALNITGLSFNEKDNYTLYLGGLIGYGAVNALTQVVYSGNLTSHNTGYVNNLYMGGIIGKQTDLTTEVKQILNKGKLSINVNNSLTARLAGYGTIDGSSAHEETNFKFYSLTNIGKLVTAVPNDKIFTASELSEMNIQLAGVAFAEDTDAQFVGLFNGKPNQNITLDINLSLIKSYASVINVIDEDSNNTNTIHQSYNYIKINAFTTTDLANQEIKLSGNILGESVNANNIRNDADILVTFFHNSLETTPQGKIYIMGLIEEVSDNHLLKNGFNGGNITINSSATNISYDVYASGVAYKNANTNFLTSKGINPVAIDFTYLEGPIHNCVNNGNLLVNGPINGSTRLSGIASINQSIITSVANLGYIDNYNNLSANHEIASGGLVYLMDGPAAQVRDSANYGEIKSVSMTDSGYSHASGLVVRNDLNENGSNINPDDNSHFAKIVFSINYGDVYAWNGTAEETYGIADETRSKAAGVLGIGLLSVINNINYGNIYSRYLASGLFGFIYLNKYPYINNYEVFISNSINYGKIREMTSFDINNPEDGVNPNYPYQNKSKTRVEKYKAFGALIGKIHTGTTTWEFLSLFGNPPYPMDTIYYGYLINFDPIIDIAGNAPALDTGAWAALFDFSARRVILNMLRNMATVNPDDCSVEPFTEIEFSGLFGTTQRVGHKIKYYYLIESAKVKEDDTSIFGDDFPLRNPHSNYNWTDRYVYDYFEFIPRDKASDVVMGKIETNTGVSNLEGLYALSNSRGIKNGVFIPDQINLDLMNPYSDEYPEGYDTSWQNDPNQEISIIDKIQVEMRQIKNSLAANVYDLELKAVDENGNFISDFVLKNPEIDERNSMITFYLPSNAAILEPYNQTTRHQITRFVEASQGQDGVIGVPSKDGTKLVWVGEYYLNNNTMTKLTPDGYETEPWVYGRNGITNSYNTEFEIFIFSTRAAYSQMTIPSNTLISTIYKYSSHTWFGTTHGANPDIGAPGQYPYRSTTNASGQLIYEYMGPYEGKTYTYLDSGDEYLNIFSKSNLKFKANYSDENSYVLSENAIINENSQPALASIPRYYGIYETMADRDTGEYLDTAVEHYGKLVVFSEEYQKNPNSTSSTKEYTIRIIRTADEKIENIDSLTLYLNGTTVQVITPPATTDPLNYILNTSLISSADQIVITYNTLNIAPGYNILPLISLFKPPPELVSTTKYDLRNGIIALDPYYTEDDIDHENPIPKQLNNDTGEWGTGKVTIEFSINSTFSKGNYLLETKLQSYVKDDQGNPLYQDGNLVYQNYNLQFSKDVNTEKEVLSLTFNGEKVFPNANSYTSYIPYGIYYNPSDLLNNTSIVDFSNLSTLSYIHASELLGDNIPSYLEGLEISPLATLIEVSMRVEILDQNTNRHRYIINYVIQDENEVYDESHQQVFTHYLEEYEIDPSFERLYKNGGPLDTNSNVIAEREEAPTVRVEFDLSKVYFPTLSADWEESPLKLVPEFNLNEYDIYYEVLPALGFEIDLFKDIPMGNYVFGIIYESSPEIDLGISWHFTFDSLVVTKVKNSNSKLTNISFVTDSIFVEFNTIIDINYITEQTYEGYLLNPSTRKILTLPTAGIQYNEYDSEDEFYVVGQVDKTDLTNYTPTFFLPVGAAVYRVIDGLAVTPLLSADFTPIDDGENFNFVHYRVFAEDYDENLEGYKDHYTDYHIAIMDVSNNVFIMPEIIKESDVQLDNVFVTFTILQVDEVTEAQYRYSMSLYSYFEGTSNIGINYNFVSTMDGIYSIYVDLPKGYYFEIDNSEQRLVLIDDHSFQIEDALIPRRHKITLIIKVGEADDWGQNIIIN